MVTQSDDRHPRGFYAAFFACLITSASAWADGGIAALGGILDAFLLFIGAIGMFIVLLMCVIIVSQKDKPGTSIATRIGIGIAMAYFGLAAFFFVMSSESAFWWVPAFTGGGTFVLLLVYMFRLKSEPGR